MSDFEIKALSSGFYVAENLQTLACIHYKVGWTTQRVVLANNSASDPIPTELGNKKIWKYLIPNNVTTLRNEKYSTEDRRYRLKHFFKYMFTRHPLDRILSAYKDKLVIEMDDGHGSYYKKMLPKILKAVRPELLDKPLESIRLPYKDILRYMQQGGSDMHFKGPYEKQCQPCIVKYDYLAKVETFDNDMNYIIDHQFPYKRGKNTQRNTWAEKKQISMFYKELEAYENVSMALVNIPQVKYSRDFEQFGYTTDIIDGKYYATCHGSCC